MNKYATLPSEVNKDPDYTVGTLMSKNKEKYYTVEDVYRFRDRFAGVEQKVIQTAISDGTDTIIVIPVDPGHAGSAFARGFQQKLSEMGFTVRLAKTSSSKLQRFGPFATMAEAGFLNVVDAPWNEEFFTELEVFDGGRKYHDDIVDTCSDGYQILRNQLQLPSFTLPDFTSENPYARS